MKFDIVDYNEPIKTSTGGRAELVAVYKRSAQVRIFEPELLSLDRSAPYTVSTWWFEADGRWAGDHGDRRVRIVNSANPNDNIPEEW